MSAEKALDPGMAGIQQQVVISPETALEIQARMPTQLELEDPIIKKRWRATQSQEATAEFTRTLCREPDAGHLNTAPQPSRVTIQPARPAKVISITRSHGRACRNTLRIEMNAQELCTLLED